jgi:hypothetical protein
MGEPPSIIAVSFAGYSSAGCSSAEPACASPDKRMYLAGSEAGNCRWRYRAQAVAWLLEW